jgi:hypothetical protein
MKKHKLFITQVPSTEFTQEASLREGPLGSYEIKYDYKIENLDMTGIIRFHKIVALKKRSECCCTLWHINEVYDTLVEVEKSDWVVDILEHIQPHLQQGREYHHYMIYLDSVGCFEFVASSWETLENENKYETN